MLVFYRIITNKLLNYKFLLFVNLADGLFGMSEGGAFNGMFTTNAFIVLEKNILNLAILLISMQSYAWLKHHKQVAEFYLLIFTSLLGMFFMISSGNLLMFYLGLEMSTIPLAAAANFDLAKRFNVPLVFPLIRVKFEAYFIKLVS